MNTTTKKEKKKLVLFKGYSKEEKKNFWFCYLLIAVPVLQLCVFWVAVNFSSIMLAFQDINGNFSLEHIAGVIKSFSEPSSATAEPLKNYILRSFTLWFTANVPLMAIGLLSTYVLFRRVTGHYVFRLIYSIPSIIGAVVWTAIVREFVSADGLPKLFMTMGFDVPIQAQNAGFFGSIQTGFPTLLVLIIIQGIGGGDVVITGAYTRMPPELYDAGKIDGVGFFREFFTIVIPCAWPTLATILTFKLCGMFTADGSVYLYTQGTGGFGMNTVGFHLYELVVKLSDSNNFNTLGYPAALGFCLTCISIPCVLLGRWALNRFVEPVEF